MCAYSWNHCLGVMDWSYFISLSCGLNIMAGAVAVAGVATVALAALAKLLDEARELLSLLERSLLRGLGISIR